MYLWLLSFLHFSLLPLIILLYVDIFFEICLLFLFCPFHFFFYISPFATKSVSSPFPCGLFLLKSSFHLLIFHFSFPLSSSFSHSLLCPFFPPPLCLPCPVVLLFPTLHFTSLLLLHSSPQPLFFSSLFHLKAGHGNSRPCIEIIMFLLQWDRRPVNHNPVSVGNHTSPFSLLFSPKGNADETREAKQC